MSYPAERLNKIVKQAKGTYSGAIIKLAEMICDELEILHNRGDCECADLSVSDLQEEVAVSTNSSEVLEPEVPVNENQGSVEADKVADSAETEMEIENKMSNEEKPLEVISSAADAAATIKKEKKKKQDMLDKIFSDNKSGRYSGSIDS
jgi:hypothetical protein